MPLFSKSSSQHASSARAAKGHRGFRFRTGRVLSQGVMGLALAGCAAVGLFPGIAMAGGGQTLTLRPGVECQKIVRVGGLGPGTRMGGADQASSMYGGRGKSGNTASGSATQVGSKDTGSAYGSAGRCGPCCTGETGDDGTFSLSEGGIDSASGSSAMFFRMTFTNLGELDDSEAGRNMTGFPVIATSSGRYQVILPGGLVLIFENTKTGGVYLPDCADTDYDGITLEDDGDNLKLTFMVGTEPVVYRFRGYNQSTYTKGQFVSYTTWGETVEAYSVWQGRIYGLRRKVDGVAVEYLVFQYNTSGVHANRVSSVYQRAQNSSGSLKYTRRVVYSYYGASDPNGNLNDLETVTYQVSPTGTYSWQDTGKIYMRHQTPGGGAVPEYEAPKYVLNPESYARAEAFALADGDGSTNGPEDLDDADLADFADYIYEWQNGDTDGDNDVDGNDEAWKEGLLTSVSGASCGGCGGSGGTVKEHDWALNPNWDDVTSDRYDDWWRKHVEETKEGATVIRREVTYINRAGATILRVVEDWEDGGDLNRARGWFTKYNADGYPTHQYASDALTLPINSGAVDYGDIEDEDDLNGGTSVAFKANDGVVRVTTYGSATTATTAAPGNVVGYAQKQQIQEGDSGTPITLSETLYIERTAGGDTVYVVAEVRTYVDSTTYNTQKRAYTWRGATTQIESVTGTVYGTEGSTAAADAIESVEVRDEEGRVAWTKDHRGVIRHMEYDNSGRVTKMIDDVDTTTVTDEPAGWTTPAGGGDHLVSDTTYDTHGRVALVLGPEHDVLVGGVGGTSDSVRAYRQTIYIDNDDDENDEVWSASGYYDVSAATYHQVGAVQVSIRDKSGRGVESITSERAGVATGLLTSSEDYTVRSKWASWSTSSYDDAGQMTQRRMYTLIPGSGDGTEGTNYLETEYAYNDDGTTHYVEGPDGTRSYTFRALKTVGGTDYWQTLRYTVWDDSGTWKLAGVISGSWTDEDGRMIRSFTATTADGLQALAPPEVAPGAPGVPEALEDDPEAVIATSSPTALPATLADLLTPQPRAINQGGGHPLGTDTLTYLSRGGVSTYDWRGRTLERWSYFDIDGLAESVDGTEGTNYVVSEVLAYDEQGRVLRAQAPSGDISASVYDGVGRAIETWVGTDATGATRTDPGAGASDLVLVSQAFYDDNGDGTGDATLELIRAERLKPNLTGALDGSSDEFTGVTYVYDPRGRRTDTQPDVGPWSHVDYNTIGQVEKAITYENGGSPTTNADMLAQSETIYDEMDRVSASRVYEVDGAAAPTKYLQSTVAYDDLGRQALRFNAQGAGTLTEWDDAGRVVRQVLFSDNGGDDTTVTNDIVVTETVVAYIESGPGTGRPYLRTSYQRNHDTNAATTGLLSAMASDKSQRTFNATWYDHGGRATHSAYYGNNGHAALTDYLPDAAGSTYADGPPSPDSSDNVIVTQTTYDDATRVDQVTANDGVITKFFYNDAGQRTHVVENYDAAKLTGGDPDTPASRNADVNRVTAFVYNHELGAVEQQVAIDPNHDGTTTDNQATAYLYSIDFTTGNKGTPSGGVQSNSILRAVVYPDSDDGVTGGGNFTNGADTIYDRVQLEYYSDGTLKTRKDQNGTVLTSIYHNDGALQYQDATTLGTNIDGAVRSIGYAYDDLRRVTTVTQYDDVSTGSPTAINEVLNTYTDLGQLAEQFQEHDGTKNGSTLSVGYEYDATLSGNHYTLDRRLTQLTAPGGTASGSSAVKYGYGTNGSITHELGVIQLLEEIDGDDLVTYQYFGVSGQVEVRYVKPTNDVTLSMHHGDSDGDYEGYDRFYRRTDQFWWQSGGASTRARIKYGYDRGSRRVYHEDVYASAASADLDQLDARNAFGELTNWQLGGLNGGKDAIAAVDRDATQDWTLDQLGNWADFNSDTNGDEDFTDAGDLDQSRTNNDVNEITDITEAGGQTAWGTPAYDLAGNMTRMPQPGAPAGSYLSKYDAWGRLVELKVKSQTVVEYEYDGLGRRIIKHVYDAGTFDYSDHYYYSGWQNIEVRRDTDSTKGGDPDTDAMEIFVYHPYYIDAVAVRYWDDPDDGGGLNGTWARHYYLHDAQFNVIAILDDSNTLLERYRYAPYGEQTVMDASYSVKAGGTDYGQCKGFTGQTLDPETGLWYFRARYYHDGVGAFVSRDPAGYPNGASFYAGYFGMLGGADPSGLVRINPWLQIAYVNFARAANFSWGARWNIQWDLRFSLSATAPPDPGEGNEWRLDQGAAFVDVVSDSDSDFTVPGDSEIDALWKTRSDAAIPGNLVEGDLRTDEHCVQCRWATRRVDVSTLPTNNPGEGFVRAATDLGVSLIPGGNALRTAGKWAGRVISRGALDNLFAQAPEDYSIVFSGVVCADEKVSLAAYNIPRTRYTQKPVLHNHTVRKLYGVFYYTNITESPNAIESITLTNNHNQRVSYRLPLISNRDRAGSIELIGEHGDFNGSLVNVGPRYRHDNFVVFFPGDVAGNGGQDPGRQPSP